MFESFISNLFARPQTYVEVGDSAGKSLRLVRPGTAAIGVDPAPKIDVEVPANARVLRETSDEFFERHDVKAELGGKPVEMAFIDGMHLFEFALRDLINLERHSAPSAAILIHDCYPLDYAAIAPRKAERLNLTSSNWTNVTGLLRGAPA
jgi:hypothetical protein